MGRRWECGRSGGRLPKMKSQIGMVAIHRAVNRRWELARRVTFGTKDRSRRGGTLDPAWQWQG